MQENCLLFGDDVEESLISTPSSLPRLGMGAVEETGTALGIYGSTKEQLAAAGFFSLLNLAPGVTRRQTMYHASLAPEVLKSAEQMRLTDCYVTNGLFASKLNRCKTNVKTLQVNWIDLDCQTVNLVPNLELIERLVERARFAGIPIPSRIVSSGRGLYLKWLLDKPVPAYLAADWEIVQRMLTRLYKDLGADINAIDAARVMRVVNTVNGKVVPDPSDATKGLVGVAWNDGPQQHSFQSLLKAVSLLDLETTCEIQKANRKAGHQIVGNGLAPDLEIARPGDASLFLKGLKVNLRLEEEARAAGKGNGFSARSLSWARAMDLRDLMARRVQAQGGAGIPIGARDLTLFWGMAFAVQSGMVNARTFFNEVDGFMGAFDNADVPGKHGFANPRKSGDLNSLYHRVLARERGERVRFAGGLWDPVYTPSNDYLINVFGITSDEMKGLSTVIDSEEKRARADRKVEGRAERRVARKSWNAAALRMRAELTAGDDEKGEDGEKGEKAACEASEQKVCPKIAAALNLPTRTVREFFRRQDKAAALAADRADGLAPPKAYRKSTKLSPEEIEARNRLKAQEVRARVVDLEYARFVEGMRRNGYTGDASPEDVQAWREAKKAEFEAQMARNRAAELEAARVAHEKVVSKMHETLDRIMKFAGKRRGTPDAVAEPADTRPQVASSLEVLLGAEPGTEAIHYVEPPDGRATAPPEDPETTGVTTHAGESFAVRKTISREISLMRDNLQHQAPLNAPNMNTLHQPGPVEAPAVASAAASRLASKRALLAKVRKAQGKEPLPSSANDPTIGRAVVPPTEAESKAAAEKVSAAARPDTQSAPVATAAIATSVIPPDLLESWGAGPNDEGEGEPVGMPDLDDGYLDSFSDGQRPHLLPGTPEAPGAAAAIVSPAARSAPALAFSRGAKPPAPAAGGGAALGFGFNRPGSAPVARAAPTPSHGASPSMPASAPVGFPSSGFPSAGASLARRTPPTPTKRLGFGAPSGPLPGLAGASGQNQDFAKLFEQPKYDADGIPLTYPKPDVWPQDDLPAGSCYTREEWARAREPDEAFPTGHVVVELQVGNPITSALYRVPRTAAPASPAPQVARTVAVDGKLVKQEPYRGIDDPLADAIADTIVVSRKSPIAPEVRGAVEGGIEINRGGVSGYFRFIRPRSHYSDPDKFIYIDSKLHMSGSLGEAGARMAPGEPDVQAQTPDLVGQVDEAELEVAEAPRG